MNQQIDENTPATNRVSFGSKSGIDPETVAIPPTNRISLGDAETKVRNGEARDYGDAIQKARLDQLQSRNFTSGLKAVSKAELELEKRRLEVEAMRQKEIALVKEFERLIRTRDTLQEAISTASDRLQMCRGEIISRREYLGTTYGSPVDYPMCFTSKIIEFHNYLQGMENLVAALVPWIEKTSGQLKTVLSEIESYAKEHHITANEKL